MKLRQIIRKVVGELSWSEAEWVTDQYLEDINRITVRCHRVNYVVCVWWEPRNCHGAGTWVCNMLQSNEAADLFLFPWEWTKVDISYYTKEELVKAQKQAIIEVKKILMKQ